MPRKGVPKVRTGCLTCKKRKVKCDEAHPCCRRCTSTGRTCDGYMPPPPGWMSWDRLLLPPVPSSPSPLPDTDMLELRSLAFYQQIVAPALCGPLDSSFWTRLVSQMTHSEPATRHAVLAISSLYENFDDRAVSFSSSTSSFFAANNNNNTNYTNKKQPGCVYGGGCSYFYGGGGGGSINRKQQQECGRRGGAGGLVLADHHHQYQQHHHHNSFHHHHDVVARNDFAIQHYNAAIQLLINPHTHSPADLNTVLLVCILFTCIEFLRGDPESAISHSQHGISLLNSGKDIKPELVRVFRHLSIFPYFFGGQLSTFPVLNDAHLLRPGAVFLAPDEALESLDWLLTRAVRLVRATDHHRLGLGDESQSPSQSLDAILADKAQLEHDLDQWWTAFSHLHARHQPDQSQGQSHDQSHEQDQDQDQGLHQQQQQSSPRPPPTPPSSSSSSTTSSSSSSSSCGVQDIMTLLILEMRWLVCKIWADTCLSSHETVYDGHVAKFQRIVAMATQAQSLLERCRAFSIHHKFMFVMGFCPLLYFVVTKCRFFKLRLRALSLLRTLSYMRETLWDASTLYAIGKRIVEMEHGTGRLTREQVDGGGGGLAAFDHIGLPRDKVRVRDSALEADLDVTEVPGGGIEVRRSICFLVLGNDGIERLYDWIVA